jgi:DNA-binding NtrC family response regulator
MPGADGIEVLRRCRALAPQTLVILVTAYASLETAVEALRQGAHDYIIKPLILEDVIGKVRRLLSLKQLAWEAQVLRREVESRFDFENLVGKSRVMADIMTLIRKVAPTNSTVLVTGESGVGKEVVARAIHHFSEQRDKLFLPVNCGAIPENLLESQLFGHLKGAFTGAVVTQEGLFQRARGGTIFLDEIGDMPQSLQVKLHRAIEQKEVLAIGSTTPVKVDVRIIAATNRVLKDEVAKGTFREDLYYRLNVFPIWVPPLRERREDIGELAMHFVTRCSAEEGKRVSGFSRDAMDLLQTYAWPGNVRQLENAVFRAVVLADGPELTVREFPQIAAHVEGFEVAIPPAPAELSRQPAYTGPAMQGAENVIPQTVEVRSSGSNGAIGIPAIDADGDIRPLEAIEADMIRLALGRYRGHMTEVAKRLNIGRSTLYRKMQEYGLEPRVN